MPPLTTPQQSGPAPSPRPLQLPRPAPSLTSPHQLRPAPPLTTPQQTRPTPSLTVPQQTSPIPSLTSQPTPSLRSRHRSPVSGSVFVLIALAAACSARASPQPRSSTAANIVDAALRDDFAQRFAARVLVVHHEHGTIVLGGPPLAAPRLPHIPAEYVVADPTAPRPRIVVEQLGARFLLYVDPADLQRVATREVELRAAPPPAPSNTGAIPPATVTTPVATTTPSNTGAIPPTTATTTPSNTGAIALFPGAALRVHTQRGPWTEVELDDTEIEAHGWITSADIGVLYVPVPFAAVADHCGDDTAVTTSLRNGAVLRDTPSGGPIATFIRSVDATAGPTHDGIASLDIALRARARPTMLAVRVRGYISTTDLIPTAETEIITTGDIFGISSSPHHRDIPPGIQLHASVDGERIGITRPGARALESERRGTWTSLAFNTAWGELVVWAQL